MTVQRLSGQAISSIWSKSFQHSAKHSLWSNLEVVRLMIATFWIIRASMAFFGRDILDRMEVLQFTMSSLVFSQLLVDCLLPNSRGTIWMKWVCSTWICALSEARLAASSCGTRKHLLFHSGTGCTTPTSPSHGYRDQRRDTTSDLWYLPQHDTNSKQRPTRSFLTGLFIPVLRGPT